MLNNKTESLETISVELNLQNLTGTLSMPIHVYSTEKVTGNMKAVDWNQHKHRWNYLSSIKFPRPAKSPIIDMLIGLDYSQLHLSLKELTGDPGDPMARLTPLGWTCVGQVNEKSEITSRSSRAYLITSDSLAEIETTLKKFWEIENISMDHGTPMNEENEEALKQLQDSLICKNNHYQVAMPWKCGEATLKSNYNMALSRLKCTERKLKKNPVAEISYKKIIEDYERSGYIRKVKMKRKKLRRNGTCHISPLYGWIK